MATMASEETVEVGSMLRLHIVQYLDAPDLLNLLQVNKAIYQAMEIDEAMWKMLKKREEALDIQEPGGGHRFLSSFTQGFLTVGPKMHFVLRSYHRNLPAAFWRTESSTGRTRRTTYGARSACVLVDALVETSWTAGGTLVRIKSPAYNLLDGSFWYCEFGDNNGPSRVYGETLTPIDKTRAVRFGGFGSPGYGDASAAIAILRVREGSDSMYNRNQLYHVNWEFPTITTQSMRLDAIPGLARGLHSTVLVMDRYLMVMGGMQFTLPPRATVSPSLQGVLLDTKTWTWLDQTIVASPNSRNGAAPSGRYGFSLIWDELRQRFLVFGGSNEDDQSGGDLSDVWQLAPRDQFLKKDLTPAEWLASLPWEWSLLQENAVPTHAFPGANVDQSLSKRDSPTHLSPAETLCLGRSHAAHHVTKDTVVFLFGSSKPSSNSTLVYNLRHDVFMRPRVQGGLPAPRLFCASAYLPKYRAIYATGGWSTQRNGPVESHSKTVILQMVPGIEGGESTVSGKFYATFDLAAPQRESDSRYPALGSWHGSEIKNPASPVSDLQVLESRRQNEPAGQHLQMVQFGDFEATDSDDEGGDAE